MPPSVSASVGVLTLVAAGSLPAEGGIFSWWTWWVGDSIGVILFGPPLLLWMQRKAQQV